MEIFFNDGQMKKDKYLGDKNGVELTLQVLAGFLPKGSKNHDKTGTQNSEPKIEANSELRTSEATELRT